MYKVEKDILESMYQPWSLLFACMLDFSVEQTMLQIYHGRQLAAAAGDASAIAALESAYLIWVE